MELVGGWKWSLLLLAPIIGSFLGVLVRRLPEGRPIVRGRSTCEYCGAVLTPRDLVPLISWVATGSRCRHCGRPCGWFYPAIELAAIAVAAVAIIAEEPARAALGCLLGWWLLVLGWIDARCWLLPDVLTLPLIVVGLAAALAFEPDQLADRAVAAVLGYLTMQAVAAVYWRLRRREGLGQGDAKLFAAAGGWCGTSALPQVMLLAALAALIAAAGFAIAGNRLRAHSALPFGPFLALASWIIWMMGPLAF